MSHPEKIFTDKESNLESVKNIFDRSYKALDLIKHGKEKEALAAYPFESHFIRKYVTSDAAELTELLRLRLEI